MTPTPTPTSSTFAALWTHLVVCSGPGSAYEEIRVVCRDQPGPAYTKGEWDGGEGADWEVHDDGTWTILGQSARYAGERVTIYTRAQAVIRTCAPGDRGFDADVAAAVASE